MTPYDIVFSQGAVKDLSKLSNKEQIRIVEKIELLANEPFPKGSKKIKVSKDSLWRIRQGDYRILYTIDSEIRIIDIRRIGHRGEVYDF